MDYQEYPKVSYIVDLECFLWNDPFNVCGLFSKHAIFEQFCQVLMEYASAPMAGYNYAMLTNWVKELLSDGTRWDINEKVIPTASHSSNTAIIHHTQYAVINLFNQFLINNQAYVGSVLLPMIINAKDYVLVYNIGMGSIARVECV